MDWGKKMCAAWGTVLGIVLAEIMIDMAVGCILCIAYNAFGNAFDWPQVSYWGWAALAWILRVPISRIKMHREIPKTIEE